MVLGWSLERSCSGHCMLRGWNLNRSGCGQYMFLG
jgi:hypothetical protein